MFSALRVPAIAGVGLLLLLSFLSLTAAQPSIVLTDAQPAYLQRQYSTCVVDHDAIGRNSSSVGMWIIGGGYWYNSFDYSTTGVFSTSTARTAVTATLATNSSQQAPLGRLAPVAAYIPSASAQGNLLFIGGKTAPNYILGNDVWRCPLQPPHSPRVPTPPSPPLPTASLWCSLVGPMPPAP
jgi:hypothetical protein